MKAELVPEDGGPPIPITRDVTVIGRREYCDVQLDHPSLSKRHAVLVRTDGLLILRDLASTNGTKVKGQRIRWAALLPDDRISFGALKFSVYLGPDNLPAPSERPRPKGAKNGRAIKAPAVAASPALNVDLGSDSDDWRTAMTSRPAAVAPPRPARTNEHELEIEDEDDEIIDLD
jgi:hypothetical protein